MTTTTAPLPIEALLPQLRQGLGDRIRLVLQAEPGAGKTTAAPLALLHEPWLGNRQIWLLEPRRLAAAGAARRLASNLGDAELGQRVGLVTRDQKISSAHTQIVVMTEGILTQRIQADPELSEAGLIILDEFHERSLQADLALALCRDIQSGLRPDLRLLLMSATLDGPALAAELDAAYLHAPGRGHPVDLRHRAMSLEQALGGGLKKLLTDITRQPGGSVLVFLPGEGEIHRASKSLQGLATPVLPLYARLDATAQQRALYSDERRIILATAVAESSLTLSGIDTVVDCGWARFPEFDPAAGYGRLVTRRVSQAQADQRSGRAGRTQPGTAWRLWSDEELLPAALAPDIQRVDLSGLVLELARWGSPDVPWLEAPHRGRWQQASALLMDLGLLGESGALTALGQAVARRPLEPRWALLLQWAAEAADPEREELLRLLSLVAGTLKLPREPVDMAEMLLQWREQRLSPALLGALKQELRRLNQQCRPVSRSHLPGPAAGEDLLAFACASVFPDRIAQPRGARGRYRLSGGGGATLNPEHALNESAFLIVLDISGGREGQIRRALAIDETTLRAALKQRIQDRDHLEYDPQERALKSRRQTRLGALILAEKPGSQWPPEEAAAALLAGVLEHWEGLRWAPDLLQLRARVQLLRELGFDLPDCGEPALRDQAEQWLLPFLGGLKSADELEAGPLRAALDFYLGAARGEIERLAPTRVHLAGQGCRLDYCAENGPVLAERVQAFYGLDSGPTIAEGRHSVCLHLLSPARRPLAVTRDLASFWAGAWAEVRGQMRGRYPRHDWPADPVSATPSVRYRPRKPAPN